MKSQRNIARQLFGLTLTLVGLMSWNTLPIHFPERTVQAATRARVTEPTGQPVSRAVANGRVAFVSSFVGSSDIYTMNPDGSDRTQLTFSNQDLESDPDWSPDGTKIAFARYNINSRFGEIFVMNADGSDQRRLTQSRDDLSPTWSPDGTKIAFSRSGSEIFVMNADGSDQRAVASGFGPAWSPDGLKLAVADSGYLGIYLINVDGSNPTQITQPPDIWSGDYDPAWSPDGAKITFTRGTDCFGGCENQYLWVVNADGSNPTQLADSFAHTSAWSPDGTKIIFGKNLNCYNNYGNCLDLFVMNPDGSGLTNITNTDDKQEYSPSWQPISSSACPNPIDCADVFVRQHYLDFLNREPDPGGLAYWTSQITQCGDDPVCVHNRRIDVSAAFFFSLEFQQTGSFVYGLYKGALGRQPNYPEFTVDHNRVIGGPDLEAEKAALANDFTQRPEFLQRYPVSMTNTQFVNTLFDTAGLFPFTAERQAEIEAMNNQGRTRAQVLRNVTDIQAFRDREFNPSFVLMQYFGYMRREIDQGGYEYWLDILNRTGNFRGMVCAFITSWEYQLRFGPVTRSNADCAL